MSSETSIEVLPPKGGGHGSDRSHGKETRGTRLQPEDQSFHVSHFFVLLSLLAATVAVLMARPSAPANLILVSLTIGAAGVADGPHAAASGARVAREAMAISNPYLMRSDFLVIRFLKHSIMAPEAQTTRLRA